MRKIIDRYGVSLLIVALAVILCILFYIHRRDPQALQAWGVVASFVVAAVLAIVTWEYTYVTKETLDLLRLQWKEQQEIYIRFGVKIQEGRPRVWIRNLGTSHFMITKAVMTNGDFQSKTFYMHMLVQPDRRCGFYVPDLLWERKNIFCDINVTLFYESATQPPVSQSRAYNLLLSVGARKKVIKIYKGIKTWYAECPKCKHASKDFNHMIDVSDLVNFEQAIERQKKAEAEFESTCPEHQSQWELTIEAMKHHRTEEVENE